ncbi:MAG TPA: type IV secretion system protein [Methylobacter sp.]|jgi:type IV secretion system protein VirB5
MKSKLRLFLASVFMMASFVVTPAHAGIPVFDGVTLTDDIITEVTNIVQYVEEVNQAINQVNQAKQTFQSIQGIRNFQSLLNNPYVRQYLPQQWDQLYSLSMQVSQCANNLEKGQLAKCNAVAKRAADKNVTNQLVASISQRKQDIQGLINQLGSAPDEKDSLDLAARISGEQANLSAEQAELNTYQINSAMQEKDNDVTNLQNFAAASPTPYVNPALNE